MQKNARTRTKNTSIANQYDVLKTIEVLILYALQTQTMCLFASCRQFEIKSLRLPDIPAL